MKKVTFMLFAFLSMTIGFAQTETLAEWTPVTVLATDSYGVSPFTASTTADNLVIGGLTRGSGIGTTSGTPAANAWGGTGFSATSAVEAVDENEFVTFTITADTGYTFSIAGIDPYNIRRSNTGPDTGQWQYQIGTGTFTDIGSAITWGGTTTGAGNNQSAIDLSGISDLQEVEAGTTVTFRLLVWKATGNTGGTFYFNGNNSATYKTLTVLGSVEEESGSTPLTYCQINSDYWGIEEITSVVFGNDTTITNANDTDILVDFTSTVADVEQGESYTITVKGNSYGDYDNEYVAFIDWNQNGVLDDAGEVYYIGLIYDSTGYDNKTAFTDISVPLTALTGETRIRITKTYTEQLWDVYLNIDPCYISYDEYGWGIEGSYGQALDFTINVLADDPCTETITPVFAQVNSICEGGFLAPLPTTSTNGIIGTWSPALDNTQTTEYTFTPDAEQCAETATMTISVNPTTTPTFSQVAPICAGDDLEPLPMVSNQGITGTWSPAPNNQETTTYTFTPDAEQCAEEVEMTIEVTPNVVPEFMPVAPICAGDDLEPLPMVSNQGIAGTWSPALNNMETTTYEFTPNAGQCATSVTMTIVVNTVSPPTADSPQTMTEGQMVSDIVVTDVTGTLTWYSDEDLTTEVEDTFVLTEGAHTFWVTQTIGDCTSEATQVEVEVTLSTNGFDLASFRAYPNPVKDFFTVSYNKEITNVTVVNMLGQTVFAKTVNATDTQIDMTSLPTGNYFVKVTTDGAVKTVKVVKQ